MPSLTSPIAAFRARRLRRGAATLGLFALLLHVSAPLFVVAAATLRGVPTGEVCEVYGIPWPVHPVVSSDDAAMDHAMSPGEMDHAMAGDDGAPAPGHDHAGQPHATTACALTFLATMAPPGAVPTVSLPAPTPVDASQPSPSLASFAWDRAFGWARRQEHAPPVVG